MSDYEVEKAKDTDPWKGLSDRQRKIRARRFVAEPDDFTIIRFDDDARQEVEEALEAEESGKG